eukprot:TRINITY_DN8510_c0_g1_i5.p1 TRINITY_DN8510_c0_g1~~TRINITY_DN8510_c0_g1_i5.p1  ORF type:complete len:107 (+),score=10.30 TRINITY_DN8510_c0_g1_i5:2002-2322(+)
MESSSYKCGSPSVFYVKLLWSHCPVLLTIGPSKDLMCYPSSAKSIISNCNFWYFSPLSCSTFLHSHRRFSFFETNNLLDQGENHGPINWRRKSCTKIVEGNLQSKR